MMVLSLEAKRSIANEVIAGKYCPLCFREVDTSNGPAECCGVLLSWVWATPEEYENWYSTSAYHEDEQVANGQRPYHERYADSFLIAGQRLRTLGAVLHNRRALKMLDVGAGNFAYVNCANDQGNLAFGIDPHPLHKNCKRGSWEDVYGTFDVITMHDLIEHLIHPRACLAHLRKCLAPSGCLVIETPEWKSPHQLREGMDWRHIRPRQHLAIFSRASIERLYEEAGFEVVGFTRPLRASLGKQCHYLQIIKDGENA